MAKSWLKGKLSLREQLFATAALAILLLLLSDLFVLRPIARRLDDLDREITSKRLSVREAQAMLQKRAQVEEDWNQLQDQLKANYSPEVHHAGMIGAIEEIGAESEVLQKAVEGSRGPLKLPKPTFVEGDQGVEYPDILTEYGVSVELQGDMQGFIRFLHRIQEHPELYRLRSLSITPHGRSEGTDGAVRGSGDISMVLIE